MIVCGSPVVSAASVQILKGGYDVLGLHSFQEIGCHMAVAYDSGPIDHKRARHREVPAPVGVVAADIAVN